MQRDFDRQRHLMVRDQIGARGVRQPEVLNAMRTVPRHAFVPTEVRDRAYDDEPLRIGEGQTISQPYIVAYMTELLELETDDRVLEIGTGSGYHAAVLSRIAAEVYSIEILEPLAKEARRTLADLGYDNVFIRVADGYEGWPDKAPFDAIVLTAAPRDGIPPPLLEQLVVGGRLVAPVGDGFAQELRVVIRTADGFEQRSGTAVRFVPMTGRDQEQSNRDER
jgi:protein-L-isoaspartate(D-aspartate) O-methyltransferase